jgi:hypothetical protein
VAAAAGGKQSTIFFIFLRECKVSFQCSNRTIASIILQIANSYRGITGNTSLDEAGYRKYGDYDFWAIKANDSTNNDHSVFEWKGWC